jgi:hypothetical protein
VLLIGTPQSNYTLFSRILTYLLPLRLLRGHLPSQDLLKRFPELEALYQPFISAIRQGNLKAFDDALYDPAAQKKLLDLGLYLILEKAREICTRGLFRKVCVDLFPAMTFTMTLEIAG